MARYDDPYRYDDRGGRGFRPQDDRAREADAREAYTVGGFGPEWRRGAGGSAGNGDFRPHGGLGGGSETEFGGAEGGGWGDDSSLNGPARYGLGPYYRRLQQRRRPDDELKQEVEEALFYDTWVDAESITVEVSDGVVVLRGDLPDHEEIRYATDDAWDVEGVRGVRSELRVNSSRRKPLDWVGGKRDGDREGNGRASQSRGDGQDRGG